MKGLLSLLIFSMVLPAHAGIVIYGTRIIYPAENKEVMVQLMNQGNRSSLHYYLYSFFLWSFLHMPELLSTGRALFTRQKIKKLWCS